VYNAAQKEYQDLFGQAAAYASAVIKDPIRSAAYEKLIRADKRKRGTSVYHAAMQAFMAKYSHKMDADILHQVLQQYLSTYPLPAVQAKALEYLIAQGKLSNAIYQQLNTVSKATATRHLQQLVKLGIISTQGKGAGAIYALVNDKQDAGPGIDQEQKELI
jgi:predicted HTH transcriptional regulator